MSLLRSSDCFASRNFRIASDLSASICLSGAGASVVSCAGFMSSVAVKSAGLLPNANSIGVTPPCVTIVFLEVHACLNNCLYVILGSNGSSCKEISISETCLLNMRMAASALFIWPWSTWSERNWPNVQPAIVFFHFDAHESLISNNVFWIQLIRFEVLLRMRDFHRIWPILNNICSSQGSYTIIQKKELNFWLRIDRNFSMINESKFTKNPTSNSWNLSSRGCNLGLGTRVTWFCNLIKFLIIFLGQLQSGCSSLELLSWHVIMLQVEFQQFS